MIGALRELGFKVDDELAEEIRRGRDFIQLTDGPYDLDLVYAPDGIEGYEDAPPGGRDGRLPAVLDRRRHREQEAVEPGKGPGAAPAAGGLRRYLKREQPPETEPLPPRHRGCFALR